MLSINCLFLFGIFDVLCLTYATYGLTIGSEPRIFSHYSKLFILSHVAHSYYKCEFQCKRFGFVMGTIHSESQSMAAMKLLNDSNVKVDVWLGGTNLGTDPNVGNNFYWLDNGDFLRFSKIPHKHSSYKNTCLYLARDGSWYGHNCFTIFHRYLCIHPYYADLENRWITLKYEW